VKRKIMVRALAFGVAVCALFGGAASASVIVTDGLMQGTNDARIGGTTGADGNTSSGLKEATLAGTSMSLVVPQASRSQGATPATTCGSSATGSYVTDVAGTTITTASSATSVSNNIGLPHQSGDRKNFSDYPSETGLAEHDYLTSWGHGGVDSSMNFTVDTLSDYNWSAMLIGTVSGNTGAYSANGGNGYFTLCDITDIYNPITVFNFETLAPGSQSGSGQLAPGTYTLAWGAYVNSISENRAAPYSAITGDQSGSSDHSLSGTLTITAVPEPATMSLLALGGLVLIRRRRKA
jgi:hypothetical protein